VWGLRGARKTQLVLDYVQQYRTDYKAIFWMEAGQKESLERDFVNLYYTLFRLKGGNTNEIASVEEVVVTVKSWFASRQGPWLVVFNSADAIDNPNTKDYIDIKHFIPNIASLHVIITTRSKTAKDMTRLDGVHMGEMEEVEATELFYRYSRLQQDD
jgi:hypothetical protein